MNMQSKVPNWKVSHTVDIPLQTLLYDYGEEHRIRGILLTMATTTLICQEKQSLVFISNTVV